MTARRLQFKPGLRESERQSQKALDHWRLLSANPDAPRIDLGAKPKRERGPVNVDESEAPVQAAIVQLLRVHPRVWIGLRMNSGMAYSDGGAPVWFHKLVRAHADGDCVMTDFWGVLYNPGPLPFAIEAKRPDWRGVSRGQGKQAIREQAQERFIACVRACGGVGGFARSVDEARAILEGA